MSETITEIANEVDGIATVDYAKVHHNEDNQGIAVRFNTTTVPESFNGEMLSNGFAVARITQDNGSPVVFYKNITEF